jgi:gas vesicle protein GvpN
MRQSNPASGGTLRLEPREDFVVTPLIADIAERASAYLEADYPVHLCGAAGTGKTTLAMHVAALRGRPVILICGDEEFATSDLMGGQKGFSSKKVIDNFIHSVLKTEESMRTQWVDNRVTTACKNGFTLVYDEFSRSRPEANNVFLSILEEKIIVLPQPRHGEIYIPVHPDFRAIFTSNPEEYVGVHKTQDALLDRMMTIELSHYDRDTEIAITRAKSGLSEEEAAKIVDIVRDFRTVGVANFRPTIRACIMIAHVVAARGGEVRADDPIFFQTCTDVLGSDTVKVKRDGVSITRDEIKRLIEKHCGMDHKAQRSKADVPLKEREKQIENSARGMAHHLPTLL